MKSHAAVVFVHGLAKKPPKEKLIELRDWGLSRGNPNPDVFPPPNRGISLRDEGVESFMTYYADVFYGNDFDTDLQSYFESVGGLEADLALDGLDESSPAPPPMPDTLTPREQKFLLAFETKLALQANAEVPARAAGTEALAENFEIARFLPSPIRQAIIKKAAMEAYYFLFNKEFTQPNGNKVMVRKTLRDLLLTELAAASEKAEKVVVVAHSMGTILAYDVLRNCPECPPVSTLFTLGSPLGISEVRDELVAIGQERTDFPAAKLERWINIYDPLDPICGADPRFANDYSPVDGKSVEDVRESNWGRWRHTITHYLAGTQFRSRLADATGIDLE